MYVSLLLFILEEGRRKERREERGGKKGGKKGGEGREEGRKKRLLLKDGFISLESWQIAMTAE